MPSKKKIAIGGVYAIKWADHHSFQDPGPWVDIASAVSAPPVLCLTYGRVVGEDKDHWVVAGTDGDILNPDRGVISDVNKLLKSAIVEWKKLL